MATTTTNLGLIKPAGSDKIRIAQINGNMDILDEKVGAVGNTSLQTQATLTANELAGAESAIAIVASGNTHGAIAAGQYVFVKNNTTLDNGLYTANSAIAANAELSSSNLTAVSDGGLNATNAAIAKLNSESNSTNDILASAVSASGTMAFKAGGSSYTGTVPRDAFKYGMFIVETRNTNKSVVAIANDGGIATNYYNGSAWNGWQELAPRNNLYTTSASTHTYQSRAVQFSKCGGCVSVRFDGLVSLTGNATTKICDTPSGYSPQSTFVQDMWLSGTKVRFTVDSSQVSTYVYSSSGYSDSNTNVVLTYSSQV